MTTGVRLIFLACAACTALFLSPPSAAAQGGGEAGTSLADLARQQQLKQHAEAKKPAKIFTNDDFPASPPKSPSTKSSAETPAAETGKTSETPASDSAASGTGPHDEAYFRGEMQQLRKNLESDKARLAEIQQALRDHEKNIPFNAVILGQPGSDAPGTEADQKATVTEPGQPVVEKSYNNDPRWAADPEGARHAWEAEDGRLQRSIKSQEKKIAADEKAISDFVEQCRREDCQPGWIR